MDYAALKALIQADPNLVAKADAGDDSGVADALNAPTVAVKVQYQLTTLKVLDLLGPTRGTTVMASLRASANYAEIVKLLDDVRAGVNLNHPDADAMFASLVSGSIITQAESDQILALRNSAVGRAMQSLGVNVTHIDVALAWRLP